MAQLVGLRSCAGGGSIPRWSASKPQVVTRRKAKGAGQKKILGFVSRNQCSRPRGSVAFAALLCR